MHPYPHVFIWVLDSKSLPTKSSYPLSNLPDPGLFFKHFLSVCICECMLHVWGCLWRRPEEGVLDPMELDWHTGRSQLSNMDAENQIGSFGKTANFLY